MRCIRDSTGSEGFMAMRLMCIIALTGLASFDGSRVWAQDRPTPAPLPAGQTNNPFPQPIVSTEGVITVTLREFASLPDINGVAARAMTLVEEPATRRRLFVSDMHGLLYVLGPDGKTVSPYVDLRDSKWGFTVQSQGRERGLQSFTLQDRKSVV